jgi:hypothetical protein
MYTRKILTLVLCLVCALPAAAQQAGLAGLIGVVQDPSGATIPGAKVVVTNESKGITRNLESNAEGIFSAPSLVPAAGYSVTVDAQGFAQFKKTGIELLVGQQINLPIVLQVAGSTQIIEVTAGAPIVETTKTGVSQVVTTGQIDNLPINGRRVDSFVLLTPGVTNDGTFGLVSFRGIAGSNSFLTDGNDTTNTFYNENAGRTRISSQISQDAVQEFQVLTNGYSAEFGRAAGGVINTVTRSGTNDIHGTGYWFFRNHSLNAIDRYANFNPKESRHQAGGSLGGSIIKDRLFYFFNGEVTRRKFPLVNRLINPNLFNPDGSLRATDNRGIRLCGDPAARDLEGNPRPATAAQCQAAFGILGRQFQTLDRTADTELGFGKIDWRPNDADSFSFSMNYLRWISPNGIQTQAVLTNGNGIGNNANSTVRTRYGRAQWTRVLTPTAVNEFRFGWFKDRLFDEVNPELIPAQTGRLGLTVAGQSNLGTAIDYPRLNPSEQRFQLVNTLSWIKGRHNFKIGGDFITTQDYVDILRNRFGSYNYADFNAFALDLTNPLPGSKNWQSFTQTFGNPVLDFTTKDLALFFQDQFRVSSALTLNYGVRYELTDIMQPPLSSPLYPDTGRIPEPRKNFAPRFGLAYAFPDQKTVFRGGYGIFFARFPGAMLQSLYYNNGVSQLQVTLTGTNATDRNNGPVFPAILPASYAQGRTPPPGVIDINVAAPDFRSPYTQQADIAIERQLTANLGLTVSYVWTRGIALLTTRDLNVGALGPEVTYRINDSSGNQTGSYSTPTYRLANRINPAFRRIVQIENGGRTWYDGLIVQLRKRMSHGLEGSVAYTWSHAIDNANQGGGTNALFFDSIRSTFSGDYSNDKGSSQLDQRHRLVVNSIWAPTFTKNTGWWARYLVNGWQLSQITTLATPQPATATIRISGAPFTGAAFNTSLNGLGGSNRVPFLPWNSLDIDSVHRVDARLTKALPFTERVQAYLNFEAFNVFNTISNTFVNTEAYSLVGGVLTPSSGLGNGNQSQGFPDGTNARRAQVSLRVVF